MRRQRFRRKPTSYQMGLWAEAMARFWLRLKFYRILASRYKTPFGEIDIVARKGQTLVFVEVKKRGDLAAASLAISLAQQSRIERAAQAFLASHPLYAACDGRFDAILVRSWGLPYHILSAWQEKIRLN